MIKKLCKLLLGKSMHVLPREEYVDLINDNLKFNRDIKELQREIYMLTVKGSFVDKLAIEKKYKLKYDTERIIMFGESSVSNK